MPYVDLGTHKRGDTFVRYIDIADNITGDPVDIDVTAMRCQIRTSGDMLIDTLVVSKEVAVVGRYYITAEDTSSYPVTEVYLDIEFDLNGRVQSTDTCKVTIVRDVTHE